MKVDPTKAFVLAEMAKAETLTGAQCEGPDSQNNTVRRGKVIGGCFSHIIGHSGLHNYHGSATDMPWHNVATMPWMAQPWHCTMALP